MVKHEDVHKFFAEGDKKWPCTDEASLLWLQS